jgi:kynurenine formamidase
MTCPDTNSAQQWIFLSHILSAQTPAYGGGQGLGIETARSITSGDSSNSVTLMFSNHLGTHVDAPRHFVADGKTVDAYDAKDWIFTKVFLVDIPANEGEVVDIQKVEIALANCNDADLLLLRTGFENRRGGASYWAASPGFDPRLSAYLSRRLPSLSAIGMDTISISSMKHREMGREVHREFLGAGVRIFEDMALANAQSADNLEQVIAMPLRFDNADGSPCTVIGYSAI